MSNTRYNLDTTNNSDINVKLNYISSSQYGRDWESVIHVHQFTELFYITNGDGSFIIDGQTMPVKKDDFVIINPYIEHTEISYKTCPMEYIAFGIEGLVFVKEQLQSISSTSIHNFSPYRDEILFYLHALLREVRKQENQYENACQNLLELLIICLIRRTTYTIATTNNKWSHKECTYIKHYIDCNFMENITLESLAKTAHMNKYYLIHSFTKYLGISPINYLINRRIKESKYLLENTNYSILHISNITGFSSLSYFSQAFKKNTGISPNTYRKQKKDTPLQVQ